MGSETNDIGFGNDLPFGSRCDCDDAVSFVPDALAASDVTVEQIARDRRIGTIQVLILIVLTTNFCPLWHKKIVDKLRCSYAKALQEIRGIM